MTIQVLGAFDDMATAVARRGVIEGADWKAENSTDIHSENAQGVYDHPLLGAILQPFRCATPRCENFMLKAT